MRSSFDFLERTFQICKGVGPWRERDLWARGIETWNQFEAQASCETVMSKALDRTLMKSIADARRAAQSSDLLALSHLVSRKEHWRLYRIFEADTVFLDLEADGERQPTLIGLFDSKGIKSCIRGRDFQAAEERLAQAKVWVTFNGGSFDLPILKQLFPGLRQPPIHIDVKLLLARLRLGGGLKAIEETAQLNRPAHLKGLGGQTAIVWWNQWKERADRNALRLLTEYNLYDVVNLKCLLEWAQWQLADRYRWKIAAQRVFERGDVLYDMSRVIAEI